MKAGRAFILTAALLASAPLYADTDTYMPSNSGNGLVSAPSANTSPAALIAKAFKHKVWTCESTTPGQGPTLAPVVRDQTPCTLSPFKHDQWGICPAFPASPVLPLPPESPKPELQQAFVVGDQIDSIQQGQSLITGDVQLDQGDRRVTSRSMTYDSATGLAVAKQDVNYFTPQLIIASPTGRYDTNKGFGSFDDADFFLPLRHGHGSAKLVNSLDTDHTQMFGVEYTTCPPDKVDWSLDAPDMFLDSSTNTGEAHDVTIHFLGVPIFWTPYMNFPISDDRKSGFLGAEFSIDSVNGIEAEAPYYLNLAPNYDATLYPRVISKRGIQTGADFEILTPISYDYIYASYMPHDMVYDKEYGLLGDHERGQLIINHRLQFTDSLSMSGLYNWVSDDNFFHDLNSDLPITSSTYLNRDLIMKYIPNDELNVETMMQDFQVIDTAITPENYPYRRIPRTTFSWGNYDDMTGAEYSVDAELVRFQRAGRLGAWRLDASPSISYPLSASGGYFNPTLAWRYTDYDLAEQQQTLPPGSPQLVQNPFLGDAHFARSLPIFNIDTGLYFDRDAGDYLQTLEPQLYYLRVPYRNQSEIPSFDTLATQFSYTQLFATNSFYGGDRQADANQLSYALTSRLLDTETGAEVLRGDIGQIRYFSDRKITFNGVPQTNLFSDIAGDVAYVLNDEWTATYQQLWSPVTRRTDMGNVLLQYHPGYHQVVNLGYQYQAAAFNGTFIKQRDFSFSWPVAGNWSAVGRWNYDIINHITLEDFVGFEFDDCCWNFQILHRHVIVGSDSVGRPNFDNVFFFQLSLKGLVTAGRHLDDLVENGILGYQDTTFTESQQTQPP
ncbi:MAG TPA: LPS assembly protein LptD [Gammaproteobacteria bacterium]|nr:LPS assembly protein LptD [Gammaproteobacteria bacterium]